MRLVGTFLGCGEGLLVASLLAVRVAAGRVEVREGTCACVTADRVNVGDTAGMGFEGYVGDPITGRGVGVLSGSVGANCAAKVGATGVSAEVETVSVSPTWGCAVAEAGGVEREVRVGTGPTLLSHATALTRTRIETRNR